MKIEIRKTSALFVLITMAVSMFAQDDFRYIRSEHNGVFFTPIGNEQYAGDPMPYYDAGGKLFRILYLRDRRSGSNMGDNNINYHPISQVTTDNVIDYKSIKDGSPIMPYGADDRDAAFGTGSVVLNEADGEYVLFYTGHSAGGKEMVMRAFSKDNISWTKNDDRIILPATYGYDEKDFRDPCIVKLAGNDYRMIVSTRKDGRPVLAEFKSQDLWNWTHNGIFRECESFAECVDIFQFGEGDSRMWYITYSHQESPQHVKYLVSETYEGLGTGKIPYRAEGKLDGQSFYAGKTASDGTNRYIWGWCGTRYGQTANESPADWGGTLVCHQLVQNVESDDANLPCLRVKMPDVFKQKISKEIYYKPDFMMSPDEEIKLPRLYPNNRITFTVRKKSGSTEKNITGIFGMRFVDCPGRETYSVRIRGNMAGQGQYKLRFVKDSDPDNDINTLTMLNTDITDWFGAENGGYDVTIVTDNSVCVVYVNDTYAFTNRIYGMEGNPWTFFYQGGTEEVEISNFKIYTTETSNVIWDGEDRTEGTRGGLWDMNSPEVVGNPDKTGVNKSGKCLKYTASGRQQIQIPFRDWLREFNLKGARRLSFMIKKQSASNVVMELSDPTNSAGGYWAKTFAWYEGGDKWQKVVFDFTDNATIGTNDYPGVMSIYASLDGNAASEDVYIDNVVVEPAATVDGTPVGDCPDHSLKGRITLGGAWMKGECMNLYDFDAADRFDGKYRRYYNDYAVAEKKLTKGVSEVDMRTVSIHGGYNVFGKVNPNSIVYAVEDTKLTVGEDGTPAYNIVVGGKDTGHADRFLVDEGYPFYCSEDFTAWDGVVRRRMVKGYYNTMILPFYIKGSAYNTAPGSFINYLGGKYSKLTGERREANGNVILEFSSFEKYFDANKPFLVKATDTNGEGDGYNEFKFQDIQVCKTPEYINCRPEGADADFIGNYSYAGDDYDKGVYLPAGSYLLYNDTFRRVVKENTNTIKPLRGYFMVYDNVAPVRMYVDGISTGMSQVVAPVQPVHESWYTLQGVRTGKPVRRGVYISGGKKIVVK